MTTEVPEPETQSSSIPPGRGEHILLVDDEPRVVDSVSRTLEDLGYRVTTALSPNGALQLIRSGSEIFDCILTDFSMPGMSGIALARECRAWMPRTPIILMTGRGGDMTADRLRSHGIDELMVKPFAQEALAEVLRRALKRKKDASGSN